MAATVGHTRGGIGYVENAYATQNHLTTTQLRNKSGAFVKPTTRAYQAAAAAADWAGAPNFAVSLIDLPGAASWPIVSPTFILLPKDPKDAAKSADVMKFFDWATTAAATSRPTSTTSRCRPPCRTPCVPPGSKDVMAGGKPVYK